MGGAGVIDNCLGVFTKYIDSGFGLLSGEVAFIATTMITGWNWCPALRCPSDQMLL